MSKFYEECDPAIKENAEKLINKIISHEKTRRVMPNNAANFSEEDAFEKLDSLTKSDEYDNMVKFAYDC